LNEEGPNIKSYAWYVLHVVARQLSMCSVLVYDSQAAVKQVGMAVWVQHSN
jgi:hypothetical protein